jgi:hypothetical protein
MCEGRSGERSQVNLHRSEPPSLRSRAILALGPLVRSSHSIPVRNYPTNNYDRTPSGEGPPRRGGGGERAPPDRQTEGRVGTWTAEGFLSSYLRTEHVASSVSPRDGGKRTPEGDT